MVTFYKALERDIDIGKQVVASTHDFNDKLYTIERLLWAMKEQYSKYDQNIGQFLQKAIDEIKSLKRIINTPYQGELHIVLEDKAALKKGEGWVLKYKRKIEKNNIQEIEADEALIYICKEHFERIKNLFIESEHLFSVDIEKAEVNEVKVQLGRAEKRFKEIMQKLLKLILTYESFFKLAEDKLKES